MCGESALQNGAAVPPTVLLPYAAFVAHGLDAGRGDSKREATRSKDAYLSAVFHGRRFDGGRLPLSLARDLAALNELLVDLTRFTYHQMAPRRQRLPNNYLASTSLSITAIEDGSAAVLLERSASPTKRSRTAFDPMDLAIDLLLRTVSAAERNEELPQDFPPEFHSRFNSIGRSLQDDESFLLSSTVAKSTATYSTVVRERLVKAAEIKDAPLSIYGSLSMLDLERRSFRFETPDGRVDGTYENDLEGDLQRAIASAVPSRKYTDGQPAFRLDGIASMQGNRRLAYSARRIGPVHFASVEQPHSDTQSRVRALLKLEDGWLDGDGQRILEVIAEEFLLVMLGLASRGAPAPAVFPTAEGALRAEWDLPGFELVWEISDLDPKYFCQLRRIESVEFESIPIDPAAGPSLVANQLAETLRNYSEGT